MGRLHRGNDTKLREARDIVWRQDLSVFDSQPWVAGLVHLFEGAYIGIQHHAVGSITDGMSTNLRSAFERATSQAVDFRSGSSDHPSCLRVVAIGLKQRCASRTQCSIGKELERTDGQLMVRIYFRSSLQPLCYEGLIASIQHGVNAERQTALMDQLAKCLDHDGRDLGFV